MIHEMSENIDAKLLERKLQIGDQKPDGTIYLGTPRIPHPNPTPERGGQVLDFLNHLHFSCLAPSP